jgi:hypothetical protein
VIRFLSAGFWLLEIDDELASASLSDAFEQYIGYPPNFTPSGDAVTGFHLPSGDAFERQLVVSRRANKPALRRALTLIGMRHRLSGIRVVNRPTVIATQAVDEQWEPDLVEVPYDLDGVSIWPGGTGVTRDVVLLELIDEPGTFLSAALRPTRILADARPFTDAEAARNCMRTVGDRALRLVWRAVALAELDQRNAGCR